MIQIFFFVERRLRQKHYSRKIQPIKHFRRREKNMHTELHEYVCLNENE